MIPKGVLHSLPCHDKQVLGETCTIRLPATPWAV